MKSSPTFFPLFISCLRVCGGALGLLWCRRWYAGGIGDLRRFGGGGDLRRFGGGGGEPIGEGGGGEKGAGGGGGEGRGVGGGGGGEGGEDLWTVGSFPDSTKTA